MGPSDKYHCNNPFGIPDDLYISRYLDPPRPVREYTAYLYKNYQNSDKDVLFVADKKTDKLMFTISAESKKEKEIAQTIFEAYGGKDGKIFEGSKK